MGAGEYRGVWPRSVAGAHLWAVGRRGQVRGVDGYSGGEGAVPPGDDDEWPADQRRVDRDCFGPHEDGAGEDGRGAWQGSGGAVECVGDGADTGRSASGQRGLAAGGGQRDAVAEPFDPDAPALSEMVPMILGNT